MKTSDDKSIILPVFNGKDEAFQVWWTKFRAFATAKGFMATLLGKEAELPAKESEVLDPTADTDKPEVKAKEHNSLGMAHLLQAFKAEADTSLACKTMDNDWSGGLAHLTVEKLMAVFKPKDNATEVEVHKKLLQVKMKKKKIESSVRTSCVHPELAQCRCKEASQRTVDCSGTACCAKRVRIGIDRRTSQMGNQF